MILFATDVEFEGFGVLLHKGLGIAHNKGEVTATTGTGHLPGEDVGKIAVASNRFSNIAISIWLLAISREVGGFDHAREHGCLSIEGGTIGCCEAVEVVGEDSLPTGIGGIGKSLDFVGGDILAFDNGATGLAGLHRYHHEVLFEETESHLIGAGLYLLGPEIIVIVVTAEAGDADADGVLGTRDMSIFTLGIVLEAEDETGQHLGIHLGKLDGPYLLDHLAGRGTQATTVAHLEGGLEGDGEGPTGMMLADVGLVNPSAGKVESRGYTSRWLLAISFLLGAESCLERARTASLKTGMGSALELDILDAALLAELTLGSATALGIDNKDVGLDNIESGNEVDDSPTLVDVGFLDGLDILHHEEALLLREHGLAMLILEVGGIRSDTHIQLTKL